MRRIVGAIALVVLIAAGCSSSDNKSSGSTSTTVNAATLPQVTVTATDFAFHPPQLIPAGWVNLTLNNQGTAQEGHQLGLVKLEGQTFDEFKAASEAEQISRIKGAFVGGPNGVDPGKVGSTIVHLDPGDYVMLCFQRGSDNVSHIKKGMIQKITVTKTTDSVETAPRSDATITLSDFTYVLPQPFSGNGLFEVKNVGVQVHEMTMFRIQPGKTLQDVKTFLLAGSQGKPPSGPPPFTSVVGVTGVSPQNVAYLPLSLAPGKYVLICFFPDVNKGGLPHAVADNMVLEVDVG